jgi:hypothetical protein
MHEKVTISFSSIQIHEDSNFQNKSKSAWRKIRESSSLSQVSELDTRHESNLSKKEA